MRTSSLSLFVLAGLVACGSTETIYVTRGGPGGTSTSTDASDPIDPASPSASTDPATSPAPVATGLTLSEIAVFQGVKVDLMKNAAWVRSRNAPVVAKRPGMLRVYVAPDATFGSKTVTAELRIVDGATKLTIIRQTKTISDTSTETDLDSTFNLDLPADALTSTLTFQVSLSTKDGIVPTGDSAARFPRDGSQKALGAKASGIVKVIIVPVQYQADSSGRLPDVSAPQLALYKQRMMTLYPAADVDVTVRAPYPFSTAISAN